MPKRGAETKWTSLTTTDVTFSRSRPIFRAYGRLHDDPCRAKEPSTDAGEASLLTPIDVPVRATRIQVLWQTGVVTELVVDRPDRHTALASPVAAIEIIRQMTKRVSQTPTSPKPSRTTRNSPRGRGNPWSAKSVLWACSCHRIRRALPANERLPDRRTDGLYSVRGVAARLGVTDHIVRYWVEKDWLKVAERGLHRELWFRS